MKTHRFSNGDEMPLFGLGTWKSAPGEVEAAVREAIGIGYRHLDCSPIYANEPEVGEALAAVIGGGIAAREDLWVTSKLWNDAHAPGDVLPALERTLSDLGLEYLDLYLIHWPVASRSGVYVPETAADLVSLEDLPIATTWERLETAVDRGLVRHIGVSNFSLPKLRSLLESSRIAPEVDQVEMHPYLQQPELVRFCRENDVLVTAYSPLGSRDRPERLKADDEPVLLTDPAILEIAADRDATAAQILIAWALARGTAVIPKSVSPARIRENLEATSIELTSGEMDRIGALDRRRRYIAGDAWALPGGPYTVASLWDE